MCAAGVARARQDAAAAQPEAVENGPVIVGARRGTFKPLEFRSLSAGFGFEARYYNDEQTQADGTTIKETETRLKTTLDLSWEAGIGHENLIDFLGDAQLGIQDIDIDSDIEGAGEDTSDLSTMYNLRLTFLRESDLPTTLYTLRDEIDTDRQFAGTIHSVNSETGLISTLKSQVAPTTLQIFHREQDQSDPLGTTDYSLTQDTISIDNTIYISDIQRLEIDYTFDHINEEQGEFYEDNYDRNDGTFTHQWNFGSNGLDNLRSSFRLYTQTGLVPQDTYRLDEQLRLYHSDRFDTHYDLTLEDRTIQGQQQKFARGLTGFRHKLYESLVTTGNIGASQLDVQDIFTSDEVFATLGVDYTKKVPYGRLNAGAGIGFVTQDNGDRGSSLTVLNEPRTFNDPFPITITRQNIIESSIRVTAAGGFPVYQLGSDYTVDWFPDRVEISRVVGGAIADGETVLISYEIGPEPGNTVDTVTNTVSLRYMVEEGWLRGLSPYVIYRRTDQDISAQDPSLFTADDVNSLTYGVEYRIGGLYLRAEQVNYDSTIQPYDSLRLEARYEQRFSRDSSLFLSAQHDTIEYRNAGQGEAELNRLEAKWNQGLGPSLDFSVDVIYRDEQESDGGSTNGLEEGLEISWRKRQTSMFVSLRNSNLDGDLVDTDSQAFVFGFRRDF
ncbi:MAG: hypothetical protein AMXMBFR58_25040 [Phycisphaerae bacterium]|nr:hypothetical protein [Phycisphaerales bacterium]